MADHPPTRKIFSGSGNAGFSRRSRSQPARSNALGCCQALSATPAAVSATHLHLPTKPGRHTSDYPQRAAADPLAWHGTPELADRCASPTSPRRNRLPPDSAFSAALDPRIDERRLPPTPLNSLLDESVSRARMRWTRSRRPWMLALVDRSPSGDGHRPPVPVVYRGTEGRPGPVLSTLDGDGEPFATDVEGEQPRSGPSLGTAVHNWNGGTVAEPEMAA